MGLKEMLEKVRNGEVKIPEHEEFTPTDGWKPTKPGDEIRGLVIRFEENFATKPEYGVTTLIEIDTSPVNAAIGKGEKGKCVINGETKEPGVYTAFVKPYKSPLLPEDFEGMTELGLERRARHFTYIALLEALVKANDDYGIDEVGPGVWLSIKFTKFGTNVPAPEAGERDMRAKFFDYTILPYEDAERFDEAVTAIAAGMLTGRPDDEEEGELPPAAAAPADKATKRNRLAALAGGAAAD